MIGLHLGLFWFHKVNLIRRCMLYIFTPAFKGITILNTQKTSENKKKDQLGKILYERIDLEAGTTNF